MSTAEHWRRPEGFDRFTWDFETALGESPRWGRWRDALGMNAGRLDLFGRAAELIRERLAFMAAGPDRFGLAHCDLRLDNLLMDKGEIKVIDFDDCGFSWYMYDAAAAVSFYEHLPQVPGLIECWLEGLSNGLCSEPGGRRRDSDLHYAAAFAAGRVGRFPRGNGPCAILGGFLHRADG